MLKKKYYDGMQVQSIITEELNDGKMIMQMLKRFADTPSADVRENVKGKWEIIIESNEFGEPYPCGCSCSECGFQSVFEDNYCPNCGAYMRGENDGE